MAKNIERVLKIYATKSQLLDTLLISQMIISKTVPRDCMIVICEYATLPEVVGRELENKNDWASALAFYQVALKEEEYCTKGEEEEEVKMETGIAGTGAVDRRAFAHYRLGFIYLCGMEVVQIDMARAQFHLEAASKSGVYRAAALLGLLFHSPAWKINPNHDDELTRLYFAFATVEKDETFMELVYQVERRAKDDGDKESAFILGLLAVELSPRTGVSKEVLSWCRPPPSSSFNSSSLKRGSGSGGGGGGSGSASGDDEIINAYLQRNYAMLLDCDPSIVPSLLLEQERIKWLTRAANQGMLSAVHKLIAAYQDGDYGVVPNSTLAVFWRTRASQISPCSIFFDL